jgi:hypothetical protein
LDRVCQDFYFHDFWHTLSFPPNFYHSLLNDFLQGRVEKWDKVCQTGVSFANFWEFRRTKVYGLMGKCTPNWRTFCQFLGILAYKSVWLGLREKLLGGF